MMSVRLSVRPYLKISVTTEPIGFYSSGNFSGFRLFTWGVGHPPHPPPKKFSPIFLTYILHIRHLFAKLLRLGS